MGHLNAGAPNRRHLRVCDRRIAFLSTRGSSGRNSYESAELAMLVVARELIRLYLAEQTDEARSTSALLERAATMLEGTDDAVELRARARLLEELSEPEPEGDL